MGLPLFPQHLSKKGAQFIGAFEGLRLEPYNDAVGYATIGYGHLLGYRPVTAADRARYKGFTVAQALALLQADAETCAAAVRAVRPRIRNQARFDALVSIAFNCGPGVLNTGSTLGASLTNADRHGVADALLLYDHAGGQVLAGLKRRREAERNLWLTGKYT